MMIKEFKTLTNMLRFDLFLYRLLSIFNYDVTDTVFHMTCNIFNINILCYSFHSSSSRSPPSRKEMTGWFITVYARTPQHELILSISLRDWGCIIQLLLSLQQGCCFHQPFPLQIFPICHVKIAMCRLRG